LLLIQVSAAAAVDAVVVAVDFAVVGAVDFAVVAEPVLGAVVIFPAEAEFGLEHPPVSAGQAADLSHLTATFLEIVLRATTASTPAT